MMEDKESGEAASFLSSFTERTTENKSCFPSLTLTQRVIGFLVCYVVGVFIEIISFITLFGGFDLTRFAILYSLGNAVTIIGTFFLVGPVQQFKKMTHKTRIITSIAYVISIIMTLISALVIKNNILVILFVILQFVSYFWYSLSFIPYARKIFKLCCKGIID